MKKNGGKKEIEYGRTNKKGRERESERVKETVDTL